MDFNKSHPWNVNKEEAIRIQNDLAGRIILKDQFDKINIVAGCDVAYSKNFKKAFACVSLFSFPELKKINEIKTISRITFPYVSGLFAFREGPALLTAFREIKEKPDLVIFNAQGIAHLRKMGLATHMGILLDLPSIGCARRSMFGNYKEPEMIRNAYSEIYNPDKEVAGVCLRTRENIKPLFISAGHKIELKSAIKIIIQCTGKFRKPEPLRAAHNAARAMKSLYEKLNYDEGDK